MRVFPKADFGLRVLIDIALNQENEVFMDEIALRQKISDKYLELLVYQLERKGLIKREKTGVGIMCSLTKLSSEIKITEVIEAFEEKFILGNSEKSDENSLILERIINSKVWEIIWEEVKKESDKISLEELVKSYKSVNSFMNYI